MPNNLFGLDTYRPRPVLDATPLPPLPKKGPKKVNKHVRKTFTGRQRSWLKNFQSVLFGRVYRSAAPGYSSNDAVQIVHGKTLSFLKAAAFKRVISLNERPMDGASKQALTNIGITYTHLGTKDFQPIKAKDIETGVGQIDSGKSLVYCGFGQGRTGSLIAAWACVYLWKRKPTYFHLFTAQDMEKLLESFGVETPEQKNAVFGWLWNRVPLYQSKTLVADMKKAESTNGGAKPASVLGKSGASQGSSGNGAEGSFKSVGSIDGSGNGIQTY